MKGERLGKKQQLAVLSISVKMASAINLLFPIKKSKQTKTNQNKPHMKIFLLLEFVDENLFA